ncbi:class I SAM-dependent methyltransferase [Rhizobium sp. BR 362]|uniref:class I SAM-dependent methyltransferase n=1 Tax=Rhizobium sp. BR 362 TaxID=3040670 RepID=UPI002F3FB87F
MTNELDAVRAHYRAAGLTERLKAALSSFGSEDKILHASELAPLDHFHTRGMAATVELAALAGITARMSVLDVGAGVGGPARFLAATYGCSVKGIDLSEPFIQAARYLTQRTGQQDQVGFQVGSALELPFEDATFDAVFLQHVAMNIGARDRLYAEIRRVLRAGGRFATYDVVLCEGEPTYPLPWASTSSTSFLLSIPQTQKAIEEAGFRASLVRDDTEAAKEWASQLRSTGPSPALNLGLVMGPDFAKAAANLGRNLLDGRLGILSAVFKATTAGIRYEGEFA